MSDKPSARTILTPPVITKEMLRLVERHGGMGNIECTLRTHIGALAMTLDDFSDKWLLPMARGYSRVMLGGVSGTVPCSAITKYRGMECRCGILYCGNNEIILHIELKRPTRIMA